VLLGCVTVGAFLTPPDVTSQLGLAIPMYLLYELGIVLVRWSGPRRPARGPDVST
jgi:sec-independent protein translocase protein TatC